MNDKPRIPTRITCFLMLGTILFSGGLLFDDLYTVIGGISILIIYTIAATGEKIIHELSTRPKGL